MLGFLALLVAVLHVLIIVAQTSVLSRIDRLAPAIGSDFPDPSILQVNDTWYAFATGLHRGPNVQVARSTNHADSNSIEGFQTLSVLLTWTASYGSVHSAWAPEVVQISNQKYVMYFSSSYASSGRHCVGIAISEHPIGQYTAATEPLVCSISQGGAIDASGFQDSDGRRYITYNVDSKSVTAIESNSNQGHDPTCGWSPNDSTPTIQQELDANGWQLMGDTVKSFDRDLIDGPLIDVPSLFPTPEGKYVMFFSSDCFNGPLYDAFYAVADNITEPYRKGGPLLMPGGAGLFSSGGADVASNGRDLVFHAGKLHDRKMYAVTIAFDGEGEFSFTSPSPGSPKLVRDRVKGLKYERSWRGDSILMRPALGHEKRQAMKQDVATDWYVAGIRRADGDMTRDRAVDDWMRVAKARQQRTQRWRAM